MARSWWQDSSSSDQQQDPSSWWDQPTFFGNVATDSSTDDDTHHSFFGSIGHDVSSVAHGVENIGEKAGSFFGGVVKGIANDAVQTVKTAKNIGEATYHSLTDPGKIDDNFAQFQQANKDYHEGKISLDQLNQKYKEFQDRGQQISSGIANEGIMKDKTSALGQGASAANTFLNVATLGVGGGVKALAEGGAKDVVKEVGENGLKSGAKKATQVLFSNGGDDAAREALHGAVQEGGSTAAKAAGREFANNAATNATFGAAQGGLDAAQDPNANAHDIFMGALRGGAISGAIGGGQSILNSDVRAGLREAPGAIKQGAQDIKDSLPSLAPSPLNQGGYVKNPFYKGPEPDATPEARPGNTVPDASSDKPGETSPQLSRDLTPDEQQKMDLAHEIAAHYSSPEDYLKQTAKNAWTYDKGQSGGDMVSIPQDYGQNLMKRTSTHTPFYSEYYADNGHAPSQAAFKDQIQTALENHSDGGGLIDPNEADVYNLLKDREASNKSLDNDPSAAYEIARQSHMDALNGDPTIAAPAERATETLPAAATENNGPNQRGFVQSLKDDKRSSPEFKQALEAEPQTYETEHQQPLIDKANQMISEDSTAAQQHVLGSDNLSSQDVATGYQLTGKAIKEGRVNDAVQIATHMDEKLRDQGRAIKAADIVGNLSPEGVLRYAARKIRKASEKVSNGRGYQKGESGAKDVAKGIQDQVEGATAVGRKDVERAVKDAIKSKNPAKIPAKPGEGQLDIEGGTHTEDMSTGEKVAKKVEAAVTPKLKKKADVLVNEITKKIKQEMLDPKVKSKQSALDVMREVFGRNKEAQEAFPEAKRILLEKANGNPRVQEALQKFFDSELGHPVAESTMTSAIKDQLKENQVKISDVIHKSWSDQKQSVDDVANSLVKEGFDPDTAKVVAKEVTDRLNKQISDSKQKVLERLSKDAPKKARVTYLDKINKLSNLGSLNNADYLELARNKLKLPNLNESLAKDISGLAQEMQGLPEGVQKDRLARAIYEKVNEAIPKTAAQKAAEIVSAPKSIMSSYDLSGTIRQGGVLGARFRSEAKSAFTKQITYFKSQDKFDEGMSAIKTDPDYELALKGNIALTGTEGAEEAFVSQLPEKIPILGKGIKASDRAYTGALTELRFNSFKHILNDLRATGVDPASMSEEQLKSIGKFINTSSGRGYGSQGGLFEKMAPALNRTLFSPRLWKSRLDMLNPVYYAKLDPIARKYALQSAGDFAAIAGTVLGLAALGGAQVETDPRSSDFLKIKVGDTRYDILGGFQQNIVFAWRELTGEKKSSTTGEVTDLNSGDFGSANRLSIISDLISNKENPVISTGSNILKGTDNQGNPINPVSAIGSLLIPLNVQDTYQVAKSSDPITALFKATIPGTLGVGVNTYSDNSDPFTSFSKNLNGQ